MSDTRVRRSSLSFLCDRANLLTLTGLVCGILAIWLAVCGHYTAATTALLWALFCDWFDGPVARLATDRSEDDMAFGAQLDSLADIVCSGVAPAMLLICIGGLDPWYLPGAVLLVVSGAIRLAHFNVFGADDDGAYSGLPIDSNLIVVTALFPFRELLGHAAFSGTLYCAIVALALLGVLPFRMPKLTGRWYYVIACYVLGMTALNLSSMV